MTDSVSTPLTYCLELLASIPESELDKYNRMDLQELLATGDPNAKDEDGHSALYYAQDCPQLLLALLAAGCAPSACCDDELVCLLDEHLPLSTIRLLLEAGANPNVKDDGDGNATPLHYACDADDAERVRLLLAHGADPNALWWDEQTALFYAKSPEVAKMLLAAGADVNAESLDCYRPIHNANAAVTRVLLAHGAEVQHTQLYGVTALALTEDEEKIMLLRQAGARLICQDIEHAARHLPQKRLEAWLKLCGSNMNAVAPAVRQAHEERERLFARKKQKWQADSSTENT